MLEHLPDHFPANSRPFPYPNPTYFCAFPLFLFLFWLNSLPEKACAVKGKNSRLNHTEPSKFLLGSLFLFSRNNFFCGSLLLLFFPNPPFLDGSAFFRCFFGVRRKEFFLFRRLMSGLGRVLVWFWAEIGQDNVLTFLFFFCYDKYMKNLGGHNSYEKRNHLRKECFFQRRFAPHSNRSLQKIRRRQRLYRCPYLCRQ